MDIDFTTEQVLAETGPEGTFDLLAERQYETLLDYPGQTPQKKNL